MANIIIDEKKTTSFIFTPGFFAEEDALEDDILYTINNIRLDYIKKKRG